MPSTPSPLLTSYLSTFHEEGEYFSLLQSQLSDPSSDILSRSNMTGHITASGLVIARDGRLLLIYSEKFHRYMQPGGHIDPTDDSVIEAAMREVREETGLGDIRLHPWHETHPHPISIDTHAIKENPKKGEGDHFHHDFLYCFTTDEMETTVDGVEVSDIQWVDSRGVEIDDTHVSRSIEKMRQLGIIGE